MFSRMYYQFILGIYNETGRYLAALNIKRKKKSGNTVSKLTPFAVANVFVKIVAMFLIKALYVGLFMLLPCRLFAQLCTAEGFQLRQSIVYFSVILSCICGSLLNTGMFDMDEDAYMALTTLQMEPKSFFQGRIFNKLISDSVFFIISYVIIGMDFPHAFYLVVWIIISRLIGEALNLYVFRLLGKTIGSVPGVGPAIFAIGLLAAYAFPFIRGYVVDLTGIVYSYVWLFAALVVAAIVGYVMFTYDGYDYVARRFVMQMRQQEGINKKYEQEELEFLAGTDRFDNMDKFYERDKAKGVKLIHKIFFARNKEYIQNAVFVRCMILAVATTAAVIVCRLSDDTVKELIWMSICNCLPIMVFVMLCVSLAPTVCKALFYHIDRCMIKDKRYNRGSSNLACYLIRLRTICELDLLMGLLICMALGATGAAAGHQDELAKLIPVYIGIAILSIFFSAYNLTVYYMCQPYNNNMKIRNYTYYAAIVGIIFIAYGCVNMNVGTIMFDVVAGVVLAVSFSVFATLIYWLSDKTFKIYKA